MIFWFLVGPCWSFDCPTPHLPDWYFWVTVMTPVVKLWILTCPKKTTFYVFPSKYSIGIWKKTVGLQEKSMVYFHTCWRVYMFLIYSWKKGDMNTKSCHLQITQHGNRITLQQKGWHVWHLHPRNIENSTFERFVGVVTTTFSRARKRCGMRPSGFYLGVWPHLGKPVNTCHKFTKLN